MDKAWNLEDIIFDYIDKIKRLISPELWSNALMDCSKNELFILIFLYRKKEANMTQLAEYIQVPLNTATGIVARMEKRKLLSRERTAEDKRVVTVKLEEKGGLVIDEFLKEMLFYEQKVMESLTEDEIAFLFHVIDKAIVILASVQKDKQAGTASEAKKVQIHRIPVD